MCNVSKGRVTQWITSGILDGAALVGEGRLAMIDVDIGRAQVTERRAVNESCGLNGLNTKLNDDVPAQRTAPSMSRAAREDVGEASRTAPLVPPHPAPEVRDGEVPAAVDARIKAEKLKQNEILTRKQEQEERARDGIYVDAAEARGSVTRVASEMMKIFEGALPDMASSQAAKFQISQREALHLLRDDFRKVREQLSAVHAAAARRVPEAVETS